MAKYQVILTDVGRQKMMDAAVNGQKVKITHIAVGDGGGGEVVPKESWTALTREVWRGEVSSYEIDPEREDGMRVYGIIPASSGGFTIREMGAFDETGDLIAVSSTAAMQKPSVDSGMSMDMEIYQYILLATVENVEVIIDGNVVGATIQDVKNEVEKHNQDPEAHPNMAKSVLYEVTLTAEGWSGDAAPYTQTVACEGMETLSRVDVWCSDAASIPQYYSCQVLATALGEKLITFQAEKKPSDDLIVRMERWG